MMKLSLEQNFQQNLWNSGAKSIETHQIPNIIFCVHKVVWTNTLEQWILLFEIYSFLWVMLVFHLGFPQFSLGFGQFSILGFPQFTLYSISNQPCPLLDCCNHCKSILHHFPQRHWVEFFRSLDGTTANNCHIAPSPLNFGEKKISYYGQLRKCEWCQNFQFPKRVMIWTKNFFLDIYGWRKKFTFL